MPLFRVVHRSRAYVTPLGLASALLFAASFWVLDLGWLRAGQPDPLDDTWEYAVAARHLLAGDGYRTSVIHPPLWTLRDSALTVPILIHGPLMPTLMTPLVAASGPRAVDGIAWVGALFALLAVVPLFRLAERHFGADAGGAAIGLFTLSPHTIRAVNHDPGLAVGACCFGLTLDLLWRERPIGLAAGLAAGCACLVRPEMIAAAIVLLVFADESARWPFALGVLACAAPWWIHQTRASGIPFFNLSSYLLIGYSDAYPGLSVLRDFHLTPHAWPGALAEAAPGLWRKWLHAAPRAAKHALFAPTAATGIIVLFGLWRAFRSADHRRLAWCGALVAMIPVAMIVAIERSPRYIDSFLPLWALGGTFGARELGRWLPDLLRRTRSWMALLGLLILPSTIAALTQAGREARALEVRLTRDRAVLALRAGEHARGDPTIRRRSPRLMFSDTPDFVAWTTHRPVVWVTREEYRSLPARGSATARATHGIDLPMQDRDEDTWFHPGLFETPLAPQGRGLSQEVCKRPQAAAL